MSAAAVSATVTELPESRVRVEAQVPVEELERSIDQVARSLGRDMKMPGFRAGKIPSKVVVQRLGREVVLDEAIRAKIGRWYLDAVETSGIHPVGDPDLTLGDQGGAGEPWTFSFEIGVRPVADARHVQGPGGSAARAAGRRGHGHRADRRAAGADEPPGHRRGRGGRG